MLKQTLVKLDSFDGFQLYLLGCYCFMGNLWEWLSVTQQWTTLHFSLDQKCSTDYRMSSSALMCSYYLVLRACQNIHWDFIFPQSIPYRTSSLDSWVTRWELWTLWNKGNIVLFPIMKTVWDAQVTTVHNCAGTSGVLIVLMLSCSLASFLLRGLGSRTGMQ